MHCADLHLDASFAGAGLSNPAARLRAEELKDTFTRIVRLARDADLLLVAGDLFEHEYVRKATLLFVIDQIRSEIPDLPVFIAPGNHDPCTGDSYYQTLTWPDNVTIFGPRWQRVELPGLGAAVHGWGFDRTHVTGRHLSELRIPPSDQVEIVVLHGSDEGYRTAEGSYLPLSRKECLGCGADYIALGHFHSHHVVAERTGPLAQYPGAPESLDFGQAGRYGVLIGTVGKGANDLQLVSVGLREHRSLTVDVTGAATPEAVLTAISAAAHPDERIRHLYRVILTGDVDPELELDPGLMAARLGDRFHFVSVRNQTIPARDLAAVAAEHSLRGRFVLELLTQFEAAPAEQRAELQLALRYGLWALEGGQ